MIKSENDNLQWRRSPKQYDKRTHIFKQTTKSIQMFLPPSTFRPPLLTLLCIHAAIWPNLLFSWWGRRRRRTSCMMVVCMDCWMDDWFGSGFGSSVWRRLVHPSLFPSTPPPFFSLPTRVHRHPVNEAVCMFSSLTVKPVGWSRGWWRRRRGWSVRKGRKREEGEEGGEEGERGEGGEGGEEVEEK